MTTGGPASFGPARARLAAARRVFLDTAPVIYFVEGNPTYRNAIDEVFRRLDAGTLTAVTSPVTLAECLIHPLRGGDAALAGIFTAVLITGPHTRFAGIDADIAAGAAKLRAAQNFTLTDAFQLAVAQANGCDLFLTNDADLCRAANAGFDVLTVTELNQPVP